MATAKKTVAKKTVAKKTAARTAKPAPRTKGAPREEGAHVKLTRLGGEPRELNVRPGSTLGAVLEVAEESGEGYGLFLNGEAADAGTEVRDGDMISLVPDIKAGR